MEKLKPYFDNSHLCGECTGAGCKQCKGTGVTRFPLSLAINNATPPAIMNFYAWKLLRQLAPQPLKSNSFGQ